MFLKFAFNINNNCHVKMNLCVINNNGMNLEEVEIIGTEVQVKSTVDLFGHKRGFIAECF